MRKKTAELKNRLGSNIAESIADTRIRPSKQKNSNGLLDAPRIFSSEDSIDWTGVERGKGGALAIPLDRIEADPLQPRKSFDDETIGQLACSLKYGMLQPILVRPEGNGFAIVDGERRFRAARSLGWEKIPALLYSEDSDLPAPLTVDRIGVWIRQFLANRQREDLNPIEEARAIKSLLAQTGWKQKEAAANLGLSQGSISKALALLELDESRIQAIERGTLSASAALESRGLAEEDFAEAMKRDAIREAKRALTVSLSPSPSPIDPSPLPRSNRVDFKPNPSLSADPRPVPLAGQGSLFGAIANPSHDETESEFYFTTSLGGTSLFYLHVERQDGSPLENREIVRVLHDTLDFLARQMSLGEKRPGKHNRRKP